MVDNNSGWTLGGKQISNAKFMSQFPWKFCNIIKQKLIHGKAIVFLHKAALCVAPTIPFASIKKSMVKAEHVKEVRV